MAGSEQSQSRAKAWAAEIDAARRRAGLTLPAGAEAAIGRLRKRLSEWALTEVAPGRLMPWLPVAFGFGIVGYFTAEREPAWWAATALAAASIAVAVLARRRPIGFPLALGFAAIAAGFATATLKTARVAHPVLQVPAASVQITGFVEVREERERSDRMVVQVRQIEGRRLDRKARPRARCRAQGDGARCRQIRRVQGASVAAARAVAAGRLRLRARHVFPGHRRLRLCARQDQRQPAPQRRLWLRFVARVDRMREAINSRIHAVLPGDRGSIASALITGKRNAISAPVSDAFYISSLAHVLAISGYHMAVVAGIVFFFIRAGLALIPSLASRYPIKKWAAAGALLTAAFYLVLSGASSRPSAPSS